MTDLLKNELDDTANGATPVRAVVVCPPREQSPASCAADRAVAESSSSLQRFVDDRFLVISLLLVVGPLGLPLIWLNRRFSIWSKVGWTVVFVMVTVVFPIALVWYCCNTAMQPLLEAFGA